MILLLIIVEKALVVELRVSLQRRRQRLLVLLQPLMLLVNLEFWEVLGLVYERGQRLIRTLTKEIAIPVGVLLTRLISCCSVIS